MLATLSILFKKRNRAYFLITNNLVHRCHPQVLKKISFVGARAIIFSRFLNSLNIEVLMYKFSKMPLPKKFQKKILDL